MPLTPGRVDRRVAVTRSVALEPEAGREVVATRTGLVLVTREARWTWYRWMLAGELWSVVVERPRTAAQAQREGARLYRAARERYRSPR
jgi:hypothetical protein